MKRNFNRLLFLSVLAIPILGCSQLHIANAKELPNSMYNSAASDYGSTYSVKYDGIPNKVRINGTELETIYNSNIIGARVFNHGQMVYAKTYAYSVMYDGVLYQVDIPIGEDVIKWIKEPQKPGYTFVGWKTTTDTTSLGVLSSLESQYAGEHTLYPCFAKDVSVTLVDGQTKVTNTGTKYNVANVDGTASIMLDSLSHGSGYELIGYSTSQTTTDEAAATYKGGTAYSFGENVTLYAMYKRPVFTVTIKTGGADILNTGRGIYNNGTQTNPKITLGTASLDGWTLVGYRTDTQPSSTANYLAGQSYEFAGNTTLYSVYTANQQTDLVSKKTVTFRRAMQTYRKDDGVVDATVDASAGTISAGNGNAESISVDTHYYYTEVYNVGNTNRGKINESKPKETISGTWYTVATRTKTDRNIASVSGFTKSRHYFQPQFTQNVGNLYDTSNRNGEQFQATSTYSGDFTYDSNNVEIVLTTRIPYKDYLHGFVTATSTTSLDHYEGWYPNINLDIDKRQTVTFTANHSVASNNAGTHYKGGSCRYKLEARSWDPRLVTWMSSDGSGGGYYSISGIEKINTASYASVCCESAKSLWAANVTYYMSITISKPNFGNE